MITSMTGSDGNKVYDRKGIADIFAQFYETLYCQPTATTTQTSTTTTTTNTTTTTTTTPTTTTTTTNEDNHSIPPFTTDELTTALGQLKNGKARDRSGILAEMIKYGGDAVKQVLLNLYNEVIKPGGATPTQWKNP